MIATELHPLVNILRTGLALCENEKRFIDHRQQDSVDDKSRRTFHGNRRFSRRTSKSAVTLQASTPRRFLPTTKPSPIDMSSTRPSLAPPAAQTSSPPRSSVSRRHCRRSAAGTAHSCSMSRSGNVWDNAYGRPFGRSVRFSATRRSFPWRRDAARADVFDYIERFYNTIRRHSTIGCLSPVEFERKVGLA
jgi:hypothetical protein